MADNAHPAQLEQLRTWQQNLNTLHNVLHSLINNKLADKWDFIALQEPPVNRLRNTKANHCWCVVYPTHKLTKGAKPQVVTFVNTKISTNCWEQIDFPSADIVIVCTRTTEGMCTIVNVYNDCKHDRTLEELERFLATNIGRLHLKEHDHMIWLSDFNRHHPLWDEERNNHLFTNMALDLAQKVLTLLADYGMSQALPKDIPTLQLSSTGNWTQQDNVFCTEHTLDLLTLCNTEPDNRGPNTNHLPVLTKLDMSLAATPVLPAQNYKEIDWKKLNVKLKSKLDQLGPPQILATKDMFQKAAKDLEDALKHTIVD